MKIVACFKVTYDEQDITAKADGSLNFERATWRIGAYDLNAIEAARVLVDQVGGEVVGLSVGGEALRASKLRKDALSRGLDSLTIVDGADADLDSYQTATVLKDAITALGEVDLVVLGAGSSDRYTQQVGNQLGVLLGWPSLNAISTIVPGEDGVRVTRPLEDCTQVLEVRLPAVMSVTSDANSPRIPGMKDILGAGKKPVNETVAGDAPAHSFELVSVLAPQSGDHECRMLAGDPSEVAAELATIINNL